MSIKSTVLSGTAPDTIYQSAGQTAVTTMYFCNTSPGPITINIHLVPAADTASTTNLIYWALQIQSNDTYVMDTERLIFADGDTIAVEASFADSIIATVSHVEV